MGSEEARASTQCGQCGKTDDHPKANFGGGRTVHFDCASVEEVQLMGDAAQERGSGPKHTAVVEAARGGLHGADLLAAIESGELESAEGLHEAGAEAEAAKSEGNV